MSEDKSSSKVTSVKTNSHLFPYLCPRGRDTQQNGLPEWICLANLGVSRTGRPYSSALTRASWSPAPTTTSLIPLLTDEQALCWMILASWLWFHKWMPWIWQPQTHNSLLWVWMENIIHCFKFGLVPKPSKSSGFLIPGTKPYFFCIPPKCFSHGRYIIKSH